MFAEDSKANQDQGIIVHPGTHLDLEIAPETKNSKIKTIIKNCAIALSVIILYMVVIFGIMYSKVETEYTNKRDTTSDSIKEMLFLSGSLVLLYILIALLKAYASGSGGGGGSSGEGRTKHSNCSYYAKEESYVSRLVATASVTPEEDPNKDNQKDKIYS